MKNIIKTAQIFTEGKILTYRLYKDIKDNGNASFSLSVSIICITRKRESCILPDITDDTETANRIFDIFRSNTVTPCTALEVFDGLCEAGGAYYPYN